MMYKTLPFDYVVDYLFNYNFRYFFTNVRLWTFKKHLFEFQELYYSNSYITLFEQPTQ